MDRQARENYIVDLLSLPTVQQATEHVLSVHGPSGIRVGGYGRPVWNEEDVRAYTVLMLYSPIMGSFSGLFTRDEQGQIQMIMESNFGVVARYKPLHTMPDAILLSHAIENPAAVPYEGLISVWTAKPGYFTVELFDRDELNFGWVRNYHGIDLLDAARKATVMVDVESTACTNTTGERQETVAVVKNSLAIEDFGPLAYDFAALVSWYKYKLPMTADRVSLTDDARRIWDYYDYHRPVETVNIRSWSDCEADYDNPIEIAIKMSIDEFESTWGVSAREWLNNKEWKAWIKKHPLEERGIVASRSLINPRRDRRGLVVPDKYLAGLPKHLQEQRVKELSESRMGLRGYQDLPTDIAARRLGITKKGRYSEEAKRRGIEYRGEYADMAVRALLYYGLSDDTKTVTQLAKELEKINKKGLAAWQTGGHRPGASQRSWGTARMASFLVGGKTTWTADNKNFRSLPQALQKAIEAQRVWTRD